MGEVKAGASVRTVALGSIIVLVVVLAVRVKSEEKREKSEM